MINYECDSEKFNSLLALYNQTNAEITRYRDLEWKLSMWAISILLGLISLTYLEQFQLEHAFVTAKFLSIFTAIFSGFMIWHIHYCHKRLTKNRKYRKRYEKLLQFYDGSVFSSESLLDSGRDGEIRYSRGLIHLIFWWGLIGVACTFAITRLCS
jgi:uncharacterized membrane protein